MLKFHILPFITGLIRADGSINWECPCLGNMISGPCGVEVRDFFSCFHNSSTKEDGGNPSDCIDQMRSLDKCMSQYPELYPRNRAREEEDALAASTSAMELEVKNGQNGEVNDGAKNTEETADGLVDDSEKKSL